MNGYRRLVAGYGPASWVLNSRPAGQVQLARGGRTSMYAVQEGTPGDAVPVLRASISKIRVTRAYFDATPDSPDEAIAAELPRHAVFRLIPTD